jgi:hypothetical protein
MLKEGERLTSVVQWFQECRGINCATLEIFGASIEPDGTVRLKYPNGEKVRSNPTRDGRSFRFTKGQTPELFCSPQSGNAEIAFLVEGETDCMRLWQEFNGEYDVFGLSGINTWRRELGQKYLSGYSRVYVVLDNDTDYNVRARVDAAWKEIRHDLGGQAKRIHLPSDTKDICSFFSAGYDLDYLRTLTKKLGVSKYKPLDFTANPPPVRWLLEGYVALGDITLLVGRGGLGKSWLSLGLALAALRGADSYLGMPLHASGRVLVVDEENPVDIVYSRAKKLGLHPSQHAGQLRYLWNQGIRLDTDPDSLIEEALEFQPTLIVLDSLTRLHTGEEKDAGFVSRLFNDGIKPLARETGAAVVLLHHHDKHATGPRGSTDIENASDAVIQIFEDSQPGYFQLRLTKSRRRLAGEELRVGITDQEDGSVELVASPKTYAF